MDIASVNYLRDELRELEARLDATPPGAPGRYDLMSLVARKRAVWRQAETVIGRRSGGISVSLKHLVHNLTNRELKAG